MRIFISWSGDRSRKVAEFFFKWIKKLPLSIDPWISKEAIDPGTRWEKELSEALEGTDFGIFCITPENQNNPWICFEAGALSKSIEKSRVIPWLIDMNPSELEHPLKQFQAIEANQNDTWKLVEKIFLSTGDKTRNIDDLKETFEKWWPELESSLIEAKKEEVGLSIAKEQPSLVEIKISIDKILAITESISERLVKKESVQVIRVPDFEKTIYYSLPSAALNKSIEDFQQKLIERYPELKNKDIKLKDLKKILERDKLESEKISDIVEE